MKVILTQSCDAYFFVVLRICFSFTVFYKVYFQARAGFSCDHPAEN